VSCTTPAETALRRRLAKGDGFETIEVPSTAPESHPHATPFGFRARTVSGGYEEDRSCFASARDLPSFTPPFTLP